MRALGQFRVRAALPPLLDALADDDAQVRRDAFTGVARLLPALFPYRRFDMRAAGYQPDAAPAQRAAGLAALRAWWQAQ